MCVCVCGYHRVSTYRLAGCSLNHIYISILALFRLSELILAFCVRVYVRFCVVDCMCVCVSAIVSALLPSLIGYSLVQGPHGPAFVSPAQAEQHHNALDDIEGA